MMDFHEIQVSPNDVGVDAGQIMSLLGSDYDPDTHHLTGLVRSCIRECRDVMKPRAGYVTLPAGSNGGKGRIVAGGHEFLTGDIISKMLRGAEQYHFFLATTGPGPESLVRDHMARGNYPEGYISDLVGSVMAELVADRVQDHIKKLAGQKGKECSNRYSPGYCSWDVAEQTKLFSLFPPYPLGISLTASCLMDPGKSVSAVVATGKEAHYSSYICELCSRKECIYRNSHKNRTKA